MISISVFNLYFFYRVFIIRYLFIYLVSFFLKNLIYFRKYYLFYHDQCHLNKKKQTGRNFAPKKNKTKKTRAL